MIPTDQLLSRVAQVLRDGPTIVVSFPFLESASEDERGGVIENIRTGVETILSKAYLLVLHDGEPFSIDTLDRHKKRLRVDMLAYCLLHEWTNLRTARIAADFMVLGETFESSKLVIPRGQRDDGVAFFTSVAVAGFIRFYDEHGVFLKREHPDQIAGREEYEAD